MNFDPEMEIWQKGWKEGAAPVPTDAGTLHQLAVKQESRLRAKHVGELVAAVVFLVGSFSFAMYDRSTEMVIWAIYVWIATILATTYSVWNWQSLWKSSTNSVSDYVSLYRARSNATLRACKFGLGFLVVQICISTFWFTFDLVQQRMTIARYVFGIAILILFSCFFLWMFLSSIKKAKAELQTISRD